MSKRFLTPINLPSGASLPSTGTLGDLFFKSDAKQLYTYDGTQWVVVEGGGGGGTGNVTVSDTPPLSASQGDLWIDSDNLKLYVYYDSFWTQTSVPDAGPTGPQGSTGTKRRFQHSHRPSAEPDRKDQTRSQYSG